MTFKSYWEISRKENALTGKNSDAEISETANFSQFHTMEGSL